MTLIDLPKPNPEYGYDPETRAIADYREYYSLEYMESIFKQLKITETESKHHFIKATCYGASLYFTFKGIKRSEAKLTKTYQKDALRKLQNAIPKAVEVISLIKEDYEIGNYAALFHDKYEQLIKDDKDFLNTLDTKSEIRVGAIFGDHMLENLRKMQKSLASFSEADLDNCQAEGLPRPLALWVAEIASVWTKYSSVPFSVGEYYEGIGYNSKALHILKELFCRVDEAITLQSIATELRYKAKNNST